jgi:multidrug transporter EmrE-like cation transporter
MNNWRHQMTIGRSAWLVFAVFLIGFALLLDAGKSGDLLVRAAIWSGVLLATAYATARWWRGEKHSADQTAGLPSGVRRWLIGESDDR